MALLSLPSLGQVVINEVVTDPQQDWSSGGFTNASPGGLAGSDDEWIELYINANGLDLTNWIITVDDGTPFSGDLTSTGAFDVVNYIGIGSLSNTVVGDYLILGNPDGSNEINNDGLTITLEDDNSPTPNIIDQIIIDGSIGTMFTGNATGVNDESVCRIPNGVDSGDESVDFVLSRATLGTNNSPSGIVLINEVVTDPQQDWNTNGFDGTIGGGAISDGTDEWIELFIGTSGLNLTKWSINVNDGVIFSGDLTSGGAFQVVNYVGSGSFVNTQAGDYLILGNPIGSEAMNNDVYIQLFHPDGSLIDDVEIGDDDEGDGPGDGAPDGSASGGDATGVDDEAIARIANGTDTDNDINDFQQTTATLGAENGRTTVFVDASATDDEGTGSVGDPKQLIQSGIDLALSGGTVTVIAGTYSESLVISKSLTLNGANQGVAATGSRSAESILNPASANSGITISSDDVTIDGFQFGISNVSSNITTGASIDGNTNLTLLNNLIFANGVGVSVNNVSSGTISISSNSIELLNLEDPLNSTTPSFGITAQNITGTADADFVNNDITTGSYGFFGFALNATIDGGNYSGCTKGIEIDNTDGVGFAPSNVTIQNVTMVSFAGPDADVTAPDAQAGIYSFVSGSAAATDDIVIAIDNADISGVGNGQSDYSGIYLGDFTTDGIAIDYTVTNSTIHDNLNRGIFVRGADATLSISNSSITGNGFDPRGIGGNPGFSIIARNGGTATANECIISNAATQSNFTTQGLQASLGSSITVSNSSIISNGNGDIADGITGNTLNLSGNWFGSSDETTIQSEISGSALVDITPWLNTDTDTDGVTAGFQGDFSDITVTSSGTQTGATTRIQEAHDLLSTDGTMVVNSGTYAETLTVSKDLLIDPAAGTAIDDITLNGGRLSLSSDLTISNVLTLTDGILDLDLDDGDRSDDPVIVLSNPVSGSFGSTNHIEGKVQVAIGAGSTYTFPMGDFDTYRPVILTPTAAGTFSVAHVWRESPTGGGANPSIKDLIGENSTVFGGNPIQSVLSGMYWDIDVISGTPGSTDLTIEILGSDNATNASTLGIARFDGSTWTEIPRIGGGGSDPFTVTGQTSSFSDFSVYSTDALANPLPVELVDFKAEMNRENVVLTWSTLTEINSDYFEVQRQISNEKGFVTLDKVQSAGNSSVRKNYKFTDRITTSEPLLYRLKMVDFDGSFEFSPTLMVFSEYDNLSFKIFPNPASQSISFDGINTSLIDRVTFYDLTGKLQKTVLSRSSDSSLTLDGISEGHYIIAVQLLDGRILQGEVLIER